MRCARLSGRCCYSLHSTPDVLVPVIALKWTRLAGRLTRKHSPGTSLGLATRFATHHDPPSLSRASNTHRRQMKLYSQCSGIGKHTWAEKEGKDTSVDEMTTLLPCRTAGLMRNTRECRQEEVGVVVEVAGKRKRTNRRKGARARAGVEART